VPAIIDEKTFNAANAPLQSRAPKRTPRPGGQWRDLSHRHCPLRPLRGSLDQDTGKGAYRYDCCPHGLKEGTLSCEGMRMPTERLDKIALRDHDELSRYHRSDRSALPRLSQLSRRKGLAPLAVPLIA
jgi:hypothetical protein